MPATTVSSSSWGRWSISTGKTITLGELRNEKGELLVAERKLPYDTLVMALGSTSNDFNTPGVKENCIFLDNPHQARRFHQEMLNLFQILR
jgi:NADH dehydrogenase